MYEKNLEDISSIPVTEKNRFNIGVSFVHRPFMHHYYNVNKGTHGFVSENKLAETLYLLDSPAPSVRPPPSCIIISGSKRHLSGCFWLRFPKVWAVVGTYEWYFVIL